MILVFMAVGVTLATWLGAGACLYRVSAKTDREIRALVISIDALAETIKTETRALEKRVTRLEERVDIIEK